MPNVPGPTNDPDFRKRIGIAFAISLALHEILAGLWPATPAPARPQQHVADDVVTISKRPPTPPPTPRPTPPQTPPPHYTFAPIVAVRAPAAKAAATPHATVGGAAAHRHVAPIPKHPRRQAPRISYVAGTHLGAQNGGTGSGAGAGNGTSGRSGASSGTANAGNGNGGDANTGPCGSVFIEPGVANYLPDGTVQQNVYAKVILRDGDVQLAKFPYPFTYAAERLNPFAHDDQLAADKGVPVQMPPAGFDASTLPPLVATVLKFTNPATGFTTLPDCDGGASPSPSP